MQWSPAETAFDANFALGQPSKEIVPNVHRTDTQAEGATASGSTPMCLVQEACITSTNTENKGKRPFRGVGMIVRIIMPTILNIE